jgi:hypothetical protein
MTKVAVRFDVSGSYMARVCELLNVPRPERGYWAKLAVGKAPEPVPPPEARPGDQLYWSKDETLRPPPKPRQAPQPRSGSRRVTISQCRIHPLIRGAKAHFENSRPVDDGAYLKPFKQLLVDLTTSEACLDKALGLANDLFNAFESVGHRVVIAPKDEALRRAEIDEREVRKEKRDRYHRSRLWSPYRPTVVYIGSLPIGLAVIEMSEDVVLRYVRGKYVRDADYFPPNSSRRFAAQDHTWTTTQELPVCRMRIVAYSPFWRVDWSIDWQETKKSSLRPRLKSIVEAVESSAVELAARLDEADAKAEAERLEWMAAAEKRKREEDQRQVERSFQESRDHLGEIIQQWANVMNVERFLAGVAESAAGLPERDRERVSARLNLARKFLGTQDPLDFFLSWKTPKERYTSQYPRDVEN